MTPELLPFLLPVWLFVVGIYGVVTSRNFVHMIVSLSVAQSSTYVLLVQIGYKDDATAPVFKNVSEAVPAVDPIVQALTLTDIVVGVTVTALLLSLVLQAHKHTGTLDPESLRPLEG